MEGTNKVKQPALTSSSRRLQKLERAQRRISRYKDRTQTSRNNGSNNNRHWTNNTTESLPKNGQHLYRRNRGHKYIIGRIFALEFAIVKHIKFNSQGGFRQAY